jgi:hypothetical protein
VHLFNPATAMFGFLRERIRGLAGRPDDWPRPNITSIPPAI